MSTTLLFFSKLFLIELSFIFFELLFIKNPTVFSISQITVNRL